MTTVNPQIRPGHPLTRLTQQKHRRARKIIHISQAAQHGARHPRLLNIRTLPENHVRHFRANILLSSISSILTAYKEYTHTRAQTVNANPMRTPLSRQVPRHLTHGRLTGVVGVALNSAVRNDTGHTRDVHDAARDLLVEKQLRAILRGQEDARHTIQ